VSAWFNWEGLDELKIALRDLPTRLAGEAAHIVEGAGNRAVLDMKRNYPDKTGDLRDHVEQSQEYIGALGVSVVVKNTSHLAWIYEYGTEARHYDTKAGNVHETGAMWGRTAPRPVFVPAMEANRRWMYEQFAALLEREGLEVTGDAAA
jgi:hypothetical protein